MPPRDAHRHPMHQANSLRRSQTGAHWSLIAGRRSGRPKGATERSGHASAPVCPFCEGSEAETEREVFALRSPGSQPDGPGWQVRVVPNKFPAVTPITGEAGHAATPPAHMPAHGAHEVIIETPEHDRRLTLCSEQELETLLLVYQSRIATIGRLPGIRSVIVFRNEGKAAGASQEHPHSQLIGLPIVPPRLAAELQVAGSDPKDAGCVGCSLLRSEGASRQNVIVENQRFTAMTSVAPRFPYETWILPKAHEPDFTGAGVEDLRELAAMLKQVLSAMERVLGRFPFNLVVSTGPTSSAPDAGGAFHWRVDILPRTSVVSGFELGTEVYIVEVPPEEAAMSIRAALGG